MPTAPSTSRTSTKNKSGAVADNVSAVDGPSAIAWQVDGGRLLVDVDQLLDASIALDASAPGFDEWKRIRETVTVFPFPRGDRRPMAEGIIREELERHAVKLGRHDGISMIIDRRLERLLPDSSDSGSASHLLPSVIETNWTDELLAASENRFARFFSQYVLGKKPQVSPSASRRNEKIEVGLGVIRTESGRTRRRQETLTMVFHEPNSSDRIEVRIVGEDRVVRIRFDSRRDPRFQAFWPRWLG